jgi:hypothetical protein
MVQADSLLHLQAVVQVLQFVVVIQEVSIYFEKSIKEILRGKILRKYKLLMHAHKQIKVPKKRRKDPRKGSIKGA